MNDRHLPMMPNKREALRPGRDRSGFIDQPRARRPSIALQQDGK
jgi:hypothetical protein